MDPPKEIIILPDYVRIDIYLITNVINNKQYTGQAQTHRLNHKKYRPFGYERRLKDHFSEARCNNKDKQCRYLNNAIRKYGENSFKVQLIETYDIKDGNDKECYYIKKHDTLFPNGYNLTTGGRHGQQKKFVFKFLIN